jgi:exonuclease SbcC
VIKVDYLLERDYGDEIKVFQPGKIPNELENLVYIEGPNSSGKSTLLNIIALGFHGLKKDKLNPALRSKLNDLVNSDHQNIKFKVELTNADKSLTLTAFRESSDDEIRIKETIGNKTISLTPEAFHRRYNLIYDIPDNPTERLNQLTGEIREIQKIYSIRLGGFKNYLIQITGEIRRGRDPKRLEQLRAAVAKGTEELKTLNEQVHTSESFLDQLEKYQSARAYLRKHEELEVLDAKAKKLRKQIGETERKTKKVNRQYQYHLQETKKKLGEMREQQLTIGSLIDPFLPKEERHHLALWNRIDIDGALEEFEVAQILDSEILALKRILAKQFNPDKESRKDLAEARVYSDLIELLDHYRNSDVILPGDKTIDEFITLLEEANKQNKEIKIKADNYERVNNLLDNLRDERRSANQLLKELHQMGRENITTEDDEPDDQLEKDLEQLEKKRKILEQSCDFSRMECAKKNINDGNVQEVLDELDSSDFIEPYRIYDEGQLEDAVTEMRGDIDSKNKVIRTKSEGVRLNRNELDRLEKMEPHKYQDRLPELEVVLDKVLRLDKKLTTDFEAKIKSIIDGSPPKGAQDDFYFEEVAKYLGRRVGYVRHLDESYKVDKIDLIAGIIITESGKKIRLTDMGTGQSQSAYLTGLLNTEDSRRIIALFDEVAMMDTSSLEPIYNKFRELYENNRLLLGIVVQKGDEVKVVSKLEV